MLETLRAYLYEHYRPSANLKDADLHLTTKEIFDKLNAHYPTDELTPVLVANWMKEGGFTFVDVGELTFEWLLKTKT